MLNNSYKVFYVENLTAGVWAFQILPLLCKQCLQFSHGPRKIAYIAGNLFGILLTKFTVRLFSVKLEKLEFRWIDIRNGNGDSKFLTVMFEDLHIFQKNIARTLEYQNIVTNETEMRRLPFCLLKQILYFDIHGKDLLLSVLLDVCVVSWDNEKDADGSNKVCFFMKQRPWMAEVEKFSVEKNIKIIPVASFSGTVKKWLSRCERMKYFIKQILYYWMVIKYKFRRMVAPGIEVKNKFQNKANRFSKPGPCMAVEFYGHLNFDSPELFSDLFFYQMSNFSASDILVYFNIPHDPITDKKWMEIMKHGMDAVAINLRAVRTPDISLFNYFGKKSELKAKNSSNYNTVNLKYLHEQLTYYHQQYDHWLKFVTSRNVKIHVCWYKYKPWYFALEDALENTGGVSVIYQRSFEDLFNPWLVSTADVVFGFSKIGAHLGQDEDSVIPYYVITGFLGDHRNRLVKKQSSEIRSQLMRSGVKKIIAYFDENSIGGNKWSLIDHKTKIENYTFLLDKILKNSQLGLVLKPKVSSTLRQRLGDASQLLIEAEKTGQCLVLEGDGLQNSWPPAVAFQAADISIHGHLFSATAGFESVLAGKCTLFLDREGWSKSKLYQMSKDVIFTDWNELWNSCEECLGSFQKMAQLQQCWSDQMDMLDPYRDGCAAERMGTYLTWLMDGFKAKLPRKTVLADAAERYMKQWGKDKIFSINCAYKGERACV